MPRALLDRVPGLTGRFTSLGEFPTPVERVGEGLWVKREDLASAVYGGNKVRKLEWLLPAARGRSLLTVGATGSHHLVACGVHGARLGVKTHAVRIPQPLTDHVLEQKARIERHCHRVWDAGGEVGAAWAVARAWRAARSEDGVGPMVMWAGGSTPLGTLGHVDTGLELALQVAAGELPEPDAVFVAMGSGGTAAGLLVGLAASGLRTRVVGVRVAQWPWSSREVVLWLARRAAELLAEAGLVVDVPEERLVVDHSAYGGGYGVGTDEGAAVMAEDWSFPVEPTYTAKALACTRRWIDEGRVSEAVFLASCGRLSQAGGG